MNNSFTPGPWDLEELPGGHNFMIYEKETGIHLADVGDFAGDSGVNVLSGNKILANANLVAASPDLLECLLKITTSKFWEKQFGGGAIDQECAKAINKALNK